MELGVPSRSTSAFHTTAATLLHAHASDYVMWCAGHGADATTLRTYLDSLHVFYSHFHEWAANKPRAVVLASIPVLRYILPGVDLSPGFRAGDDKLYIEPSSPSNDLPPAVSIVCTLALQHHILKKAQLAPTYAQSSEHVSVMSTMLGNALGIGRK